MMNTVGSRILLGILATAGGMALMVCSSGTSFDPGGAGVDAGAVVDAFRRRLDTLGDADAAPASKFCSVPVGTVMAWVGSADAIPTADGWLECDGSLRKVDDYPDLARALLKGRAEYGKADKDKVYLYGRLIREFNLPDYRGYFLRGATTSATSVAPDCATRTAPAPGGNTGCAVGTKQEDAVIDHSHNIGVRIKPYTAPQNGIGEGGKSVKGEYSWATGTIKGKVDKSQKETRPVNMSVIWIIKAACPESERVRLR